MEVSLRCGSTTTISVQCVVRETIQHLYKIWQNPQSCYICCVRNGGICSILEIGVRPIGLWPQKELLMSNPARGDWGVVNGGQLLSDIALILSLECPSDCPILLYCFNLVILVSFSTNNLSKRYQI